MSDSLFDLIQLAEDELASSLDDVGLKTRIQHIEDVFSEARKIHRNLLIAAHNKHNNAGEVESQESNPKVILRHDRERLRKLQAQLQQSQAELAETERRRAACDTRHTDICAKLVELERQLDNAESESNSSEANYENFIINLHSRIALLESASRVIFERNGSNSRAVVSENSSLKLIDFEDDACATLAELYRQ